MLSWSIRYVIPCKFCGENWHQAARRTQCPSGLDKQRVYAMERSSLHSIMPDQIRALTDPDTIPAE